MSEHARRSRRCQLVARFLVSVCIMGLSMAAASGTAYAFGGGYGPGGPPGGGGGGGFGPVIVVKAIGPAGGEVIGHYRGSTIDVSIPPNLFDTKELVVVTASDSDCHSIDSQITIVGLAIFAVDDHGRHNTSLSGGQVTVSNPKITPQSQVWGIAHDNCSKLSGITIQVGQLTVPFQVSAAFVVTAARQHTVEHRRHRDDECASKRERDCQPSELERFSVDYGHGWVWPL